MIARFGAAGVSPSGGAATVSAPSSAALHDVRGTNDDSVHLLAFSEMMLKALSGALSSCGRSACCATTWSRHTRWHRGFRGRAAAAGPAARKPFRVGDAFPPPHGGASLFEDSGPEHAHALKRKHASRGDERAPTLRRTKVVYVASRSPSRSGGQQFALLRRIRDLPTELQTRIGRAAWFVAFLAASATRQIDHAMARVAAEEREEEEAKAETEIETEEEVRWGELSRWV